MKKLLALFLFVFGFTSMVFSQKNFQNSKGETVYPASIIQLLANPEKYHGKIVHVIGYLNIRFESSGIYLHKEDFDYSIYQNAFWVEFSDEIKTRPQDMNKKYVIIEGEFDMNHWGHMRMWSGTIKNITRCDTW